MACRFPGSDGLEAYWSLLEEGRSAVTEGVPGSGAGRIGQIFADGPAQNRASRYAAFIEDVDRFDPSFFRISPLEAQFLDPQQRLMLEVSWRALEDAGIDPERLRGTRTGVFGGITHSDYREIMGGIGNLGGPASNLYAATGTSQNTATGRVSYVLGLQGPAVSVDTACSSSLVATHQAITALRQDEADIALAGGVTTILSANVMEARAGAGMLAPDGLCKTFDASADGYVRGEGCGILVLKRLRDAEADGDRIWGVIRSSALNQDGASQGLTVPNGEAQALVIRDALRRAGVTPSQVGYVETHGTGTPVGDPLELQAIAEVFGGEREAESPLYIGSVKTNFGHLESAAGIAALIKVFLSLNQGMIPKHLNFQNPSPAIDWESLPIRVPTSTLAWPASDDRPRLAGVSGYGWSGTNAHLVVESYGAARHAPTGPYRLRLPSGSPRQIAASLPNAAGELPSAEETVERPSRLLPLSGKTDQALKDLARSYQTWLDERGADLDSLLSDMSWTASVGRSHFPHRACVVFRDAESLREGLAAVVEGGKNTEPKREARVAFVYTGQGSQWAGMGETLYKTEPVFRAVLDICERVVLEERGKSLLDVMFGRPGADGELIDSWWAQPAIYSLECALTALWESVGVRPDVVIGHSTGEIAAAHAAGVYGLEDGLRFIMKRGECLGAVPEAGAMAAVFAPQARVEETIDEYNSTSDCADLNIAVDNGVHQVISGPTVAIQAMVDLFESEEIMVRPLYTAQAFHCVLLEPALDSLEEAYQSVAVSQPSVALVSNVTGRLLEEGETLDSGYWRRHARQTVQFRKGIGALAELGVDVAIEMGPHSVLGPLLSLVWPGPADLPEPPEAPVVLQSMLRPRNDDPAPELKDAFLTAVASGYEAGLDLSFDGLFANERRRKIELPGYPFQRERYWLDENLRRRVADGHPLLGTRHESPRGEVMFEAEVSSGDPSWLADHRVFERVIMPGAMYGAIAAAAAVREGAGSVEMEDLQLHSAMVFGQEESGSGGAHAGRRVQAVLNSPESGRPRHLEIFSKGDGEDAWTLHAEARISLGSRARGPANQVDVDALRSGLSPLDVPGFYRARAESSINLGPSFRTLQSLWAAGGEAIGEIALPEGVEQGSVELHPLLLDGCFQVMSAARHSADVDSGEAYLPFGWERMWTAGALPERVICHARFRDDARGGSDSGVEAREVLAGDFTIYTPEGVEIGGVTGYAVKRATRASLLSATEGIQDMLYEIIWRDAPLEEGMKPADFLPDPTSVASGSPPFTQYLADEGVAADKRAGLLDDLERLSWSYALAALERLGWTRKAGDVVEPEALRKNLNVLDEHSRLFRRMLELLARGGIVEEAGEEFVVRVGSDDPLPEDFPANPGEFADRMSSQYEHGSNEIGLFRRSAGALADAITGRADPLTLLFSSGEPTAADLYLKAPVARAANRMLGEAIAALLVDLPEGRKLRALEVGAGTGSATASVIPELPAGRFEYVYTDISAGFFSEAEARFGGSENSIEYRVLDIERDPVEQGFASHGYDLVIASNVLHATRYLSETLEHCRKLLAPSGQLVMLENLRGQGWLDLTFGQLDGWWRFADDYRPHHALASPAVWRQALSDAGFGEIEVLGLDKADSAGTPDRGVIIAKGPVKVEEPAGVWVLADDNSGMAEELAAELSARNQTVVLANPGEKLSDQSEREGSAVVRASVEMESRDSWRSLIEALPHGAPLKGVVHLVALNGHGEAASSEELGEDARRMGGSALALVQALGDADAIPENGVWLFTRGGQVLERERQGELAGALLWGFGRVVGREAPHLQPRTIDLDPERTVAGSALVNELMYPDSETQIAYRLGFRQAARLVRADTSTERLSLPDDSGWSIQPDEGGSLDELQVLSLPERALGPREVRVAVETAGLNFSDVLLAIGVAGSGNLGLELCGHVLETGADVSGVSVGDRVVALGFNTFSSEAIMREELVAPAPQGISTTALATIPTVFATAALSFEHTGLNAGERVLIHAGSGGVGLAAIQLAQAAGAEVFATASSPKQDFLRSIGVKHIFDSRQTRFGEEVLEATGGEGVHVVLNSLTGEGFIEASLSCLAHGGRFVEMGRRDILSKEEMAATRPDVDYYIVEVDVLKEQDPEEPGGVLNAVMERVAAGELEPILHSRWSMSELGSALKFMRSARHIGKIVLAKSPLETGRLRADGTYLVTGGLGGIGCALAGRLADLGAGAIVLNGRRDPDPEAVEAIDALRQRGVNVQVELADVTNPSAVDAMLERVEATLPPLAGVIHSVGVLSDAAITNQTWDSFRQVLWPKMLGAWHLHRATMHRDLDMFILFSSAAGVMGNPGQTNHAAANTFLDQLAAHRRALGLPGQAIAWGAWSEIGEAAEQRGRIEERLGAGGTGWMTPQQGFQALERLVKQDVTSVMVAAIDWQRYAESQAGVAPFLDEVFTTSEIDSAEALQSSDDLLSQLGVSRQTDSQGVLASFLQKELQAVMRLPTAPSPSIGFFDLGMDSLMAVEFRNRLNRAFAGEYVVSNTAVFDFPDITQLSRHLSEELGQVDTRVEPEATPVVALPSPLTSREVEEDGIAIVGMACRLPRAGNLSEYWEMLSSGVDAITDGRPNSGDLNAPKMRGAFIEDVEWFDSRFFRIAPVEARTMDPQQRLMLETSWEALEDAGIDPEALRGSRTGVFAGVTGSEYRDLMEASGKSGSYLGTTPSITVGRVAYALGLEGPAVPVDMACASSLAAIHQAVGSLRRGEVNLALAGGVHLVLSQAVTGFMTEAGMLSRSGQSRPFDATADGYVRGEGCGVIALKRLSDAKADGDRIWGVIRGSAVNQSGASAGLTVPNGSTQERVMEDALAQANLTGADVDYLEAHAVGSQMGDAIEIRAVGAVYGRGREAENPLLIGTVKSNIGHLEAAAGIAGVLKAVLAMQHGVIPKHLHLENPNPEINWGQLPVRVTSEATGWPSNPGRPPRAAVSAFGISGANAHVVLEGYGGPQADSDQANGHRRPAGPSISIPANGASTGAGQTERGLRFLPLSGKSAGALRDLAKGYLSWLDELTAEAAVTSILADMAWTAGVGRSHFAHRAGVPFRDMASLRDGLRTLAEADAHDGASEPRTASRVAFLYTGDASRLTGVGRVLYDTEPTASAVLDFCDSVVRQERGASLLDVMFGQDGAGGSLDDPSWAQPALYSMQCALTALWSDVGIRPIAALGDGVGELSAAQAAGVFSLEGGLRFVLVRSGLEASDPGMDGLQAALADVRLSPPTVALLSRAAGAVSAPYAPKDLAFWVRQARDSAPLEERIPELADLGVDAVIHVGPGWIPAREAILRHLDSAVVLPGSLNQSDNSGEDGFQGFAALAAEAYGAGIAVSFKGLFTGEARRRISLPSYPFQRRRHWV